MLAAEAEAAEGPGSTMRPGYDNQDLQPPRSTCTQPRKGELRRPAFSVRSLCERIHERLCVLAIHMPTHRPRALRRYSITLSCAPANRPRMPDHTVGRSHLCAA